MTPVTREYFLDREFQSEIENEIEQGKEVKVELRDEKFARIVAKAKIAKSQQQLDNPDILWLEDWQGHRLKKPYYIKISQILE